MTGFCLPDYSYLNGLPNSDASTSYAIATGDNRRADLQTQVIKALASHKEIVQIHGFYYSEKDNLLSVDVVPDITVHDDKALISRLTDELQHLAPDTSVTIVVDHNYSE